MDANTLEILNPRLKLHTPEIFDEKPNQLLNNKFPMLTDGEHLFAVLQKVVNKLEGCVEDVKVLQKQNELKEIMS